MGSEKLQTGSLYLDCTRGGKQLAPAGRHWHRAPPRRRGDRLHSDRRYRVIPNCSVQKEYDMPPETTAGSLNCSARMALGSNTWKAAVAPQSSCAKVDRHQRHTPVGATPRHGAGRATRRPYATVSVREPGRIAGILGGGERHAISELDPTVNADWSQSSRHCACCTDQCHVRYRRSKPLSDNGAKGRRRTAKLGSRFEPQGRSEFSK
jgi:hypothetical protein